MAKSVAGSGAHVRSGGRGGRPGAGRRQARGRGRGDTITGMGRIRERVQETAKRIRRLGESSQQIGEITALIDDIADRTSILALNASIQAAAAGEAGRGFAVVAEEIERLAERSATATRRIDGLIQTIQVETNEAVAGMEESTREVVEGSLVANRAGQALGRDRRCVAKIGGVDPLDLRRGQATGVVVAGHRPGDGRNLRNHRADRGRRRAGRRGRQPSGAAGRRPPRIGKRLPACRTRISRLHPSLRAKSRRRTTGNASPSRSFRRPFDHEPYLFRISFPLITSFSSAWDARRRSSASGPVQGPDPKVRGRRSQAELGTRMNEGARVISHSDEEASIMRIQESGADRGLDRPNCSEFSSRRPRTHLQAIRSFLPALENGDAEAVRNVRRSAHTLKGSAAMVGFRSLTGLAHRMEDILDRLFEGSNHVRKSWIAQIDRRRIGRPGGRPDG